MHQIIITDSMQNARAVKEYLMEEFTGKYTFSFYKIKGTPTWGVMLDNIRVTFTDKNQMEYSSRGFLKGLERGKKIGYTAGLREARKEIAPIMEALQEEENLL